MRRAGAERLEDRGGRQAGAGSGEQRVVCDPQRAAIQAALDLCALTFVPDNAFDTSAGCSKRFAIHETLYTFRLRLWIEMQLDCIRIHRHRQWRSPISAPVPGF
eukprot:gene6304-biopygen12643